MVKNKPMFNSTLKIQDASKTCEILIELINMAFMSKPEIGFNKAWVYLNALR